MREKESSEKNAKRQKQAALSRNEMSSFRGKIREVFRKRHFCHFFLCDCVDTSGGETQLDQLCDTDTFLFFSVLT